MSRIDQGDAYKNIACHAERVFFCPSVSDSIWNLSKKKKVWPDCYTLLKKKVAETGQFDRPWYLNISDDAERIRVFLDCAEFKYFLKGSIQLEEPRNIYECSVHEVSSPWHFVNTLSLKWQINAVSCAIKVWLEDVNSTAEQVLQEVLDTATDYSQSLTSPLNELTVGTMETLSMKSEESPIRVMIDFLHSYSTSRGGDVPRFNGLYSMLTSILVLQDIWRDEWLCTDSQWDTRGFVEGITKICGYLDYKTIDSDFVYSAWRVGYTTEDPHGYPMPLLFPGWAVHCILYAISGSGERHSMDETLGCDKLFKQAVANSFKTYGTLRRRYWHWAQVMIELASRSS